MQTFLPYSNPTFCAEALDNKRLNKQILEGYQILNILSGQSKSGAWRNHPAVLMWQSAEWGLWNYIQECIKEAVCIHCSKTGIWIAYPCPTIEAIEQELK